MGTTAPEVRPPAAPTTVELLPFAIRPHPLRSPALVLVAAMAIVEGYGHLGVLATGGSPGWLADVTASLVFSGLASVSALALTRPPLSGCRRRAEAILVATAVVVVVATLASLILGLGSESGVAGRVTGGADLAFALVAGVVVAGNERRRAA